MTHGDGCITFKCSVVHVFRAAVITTRVAVCRCVDHVRLYTQSCLRPWFVERTPRNFNQPSTPACQILFSL